MASDFYKAVYKLVGEISCGRVATYGQVASLLGKPRAARLVGCALANCPKDVPWQRVINKEGMISIENINAPKELQAELLKQEGIKVEKRNNNWWVDLNKYLWHPR
ncbi:MAG: MGMT family protein [Patescibacteria group bacterium]